MMKKLFLFFCFSLTATLLAADLGFYLGEQKATYNPDIPKPKEVLGFEVGEWHVRHDLLAAYMHALADASDRIELNVIGYTHERRPLLHLAISSPENLARLETLRQKHLSLAWDGEAVDTAELPLVVWMGYSVHGNESSGANAALVAAYHLAAAQNIDETLDKLIIIFDPSLNPDGLSRFAQWANMHRGKHVNPDPNHREHNEAWPNGRTNHYWFDLNRDWLPLVHPESRARIAQFQRWRPAILTDFHEMGTNSTFFFQPGIPSRTNPMTPDENQQLTGLIGTYHARALDDRGELYFTEQIFDDFYYGKGSTYPDVQGSIGILFEQASSRGHAQERSLGVLTFPQTIKNQVTTTFSTLKAAVDNKDKLQAYQREFFGKARDLAKKDAVKGYAFDAGGDPTRAYELVDILQRHNIEVHELKNSVKAGEETIETGYVVPLDQRQYRLIKSLFEEVTSFRDETFYDVSTWHLPSAFGLKHASLEAKALGQALGDKAEAAAFPEQPFKAESGRYAYALPWTPYFAPRALYRLLRAGVNARFATQPFTAVTDAGNVRFDYGSVIIPMSFQETAEAEILEALAAAAKDGVRPYVVQSGLTPAGMDLGSPSLNTLKEPKPLLLTGRGVSTYDAGELWHLLDHRFDMQVTLVDIAEFSPAMLNRYTHLLMVNGRYPDIGKDETEQIKAWIRGGGTLVAMRGAARWVNAREIMKVEFENGDDDTKEREDPESVPYSDRMKLAAKRRISGTVFEAAIDRTHPMGYGFLQDRIALFRTSSMFVKATQNPFVTVARYTDDPLRSGYVSEENLNRIKGTAAVLAEAQGRGAVVLLMDNPNFRGFWRGANRLLFNALFFSNAVENTRFLMEEEEQH